MSFGVNRVYLCVNIRSHFQKEFDILEISLEMLAIWHAGVEFANVPGELVEVFYVQAVRRSAAGCSRFFWLCREVKFFRGC